MSMTPAQARQLGTLIAKARNRSGLSIRDLAPVLGVHPSWLGGLEQGRYLDPAPLRLARLAEALDIPTARIDRITRGSVADSLPAVPAYFRAKFGLSPEEAAEIALYVEEHYIDPQDDAAESA